jgi:hypothetical protein
MGRIVQKTVRAPALESAAADTQRRGCADAGVRKVAKADFFTTEPAPVTTTFAMPLCDETEFVLILPTYIVR